MNFKIAFLFLFAFATLSGCKKFEEINTDPARPEETNPQYLLANAEKRAVDLMYGGYYNGRIGMHFSQYWTGTDKTSESRNLLTDDALWGALYSGPLMDLQEISNYYNRHPQERNPHMLAVAEILKSWIFHVLTDLYVDIPYNEALNVSVFPQPAFDRAEDVYIRILNNLAAQITVLEGDTPAPITGDVIASGDAQKWIRFANALRMRIAMRMADVKPQEAAAVIEAAAGNTLTGVNDDIYFAYQNTAASARFPYNDAERPLIEFAVTSTLIDYQSDNEDPRLPIFARLAKNTGEYRGKIYGTAANSPLLDSLSMPGEAVYSPTFNGYIITYAEVMFIKAEAAARGISMPEGSAADIYDLAVRASMDQWNVVDTAAVSAYLTAHPYEAGSWKNVIGTEKWLAMYMQGIQSWMERLRLDFKKPDGTNLFIPPASGSLDPDISDVPHRLNYPNATRNSNSANVEKAAQNIGGDTKATKNWWDIY